MTKNDNLSGKQLQALPIFASQPCVDKACEQAGISRNCFYEWMKEASFKSELRKLRYEISTESIDALKVASKDASSTLIQLLGEENSPAVRRAAANDILNHVAKIREEERLKAENSAYSFSGIDNFNL
jgi:hypothetical protein